MLPKVPVAGVVLVEKALVPPPNIDVLLLPLLAPNVVFEFPKILPAPPVPPLPPNALVVFVVAPPKGLEVLVVLFPKVLMLFPKAVVVAVPPPPKALVPPPPKALVPPPKADV